MTSIIRRFVAIIAPLLFVTAVAVGCSSSHQAISSSTTTTGGSSGSAAVVHIKNYEFNPSKLTVKPGQKVTFTNDDSVTHTATASDGAFDTGDIKPGASQTVVVKAGVTGAVPYICSIHQYMKGTLTVS